MVVTAPSKHLQNRPFWDYLFRGSQEGRCQGRSVLLMQQARQALSYSSRDDLDSRYCSKLSRRLVDCGL